MKQEILEEMEQFRVSEYEKIAETMMVPMSDGSKLRVLRYTPPKDKFNGYTIVLSVGWGTVIPAWDALLMDAIKDFDVVYYESREKGSSELPKKYAVGMDRMAQDIQEVIEYLKIDEKKLILFGSCIGATKIIYGMYKKMYNPFMPVLIAPPARFEVPPVFRQLIPFGPTFLWYPAQPIIRWWVIKTKSEDAKQAAKYLRTLEEADPKKWKRLGLRLAYKRYWWLFPEVKNHVLLIAAETDKMHDAKVTKKVEKLMENTTYLNMGSNKNTHAPMMAEKIREFIPQFVGKNH
ncbi:MAG: alpha/beta fold hydrolase [Candidatus Heimdallarchaeaceae archaeon]